MNELHTQVCFDALSVLNNVQYVESVCQLCGNAHYTGECPEIIQGTLIPDTPPQSFSRSSVPNGLLVMDTENGTCVITSQKFAKGTRFGPLLAEKSYIPVKGVTFPLTIFPTSLMEIAELETLYSGRNIYLDTTNENKCNWMIHVNTANFSNEQNLNAYQHNDSIYYVAIQDIELGDILKVWYSPIYANRMGFDLLKPSPYDICNNLLRQVSMDYGLKIDEIDPSNPSSSTYASYHGVISSEKDREIALPPVISLMKISSPNYSTYTLAAPSSTTSSHVFDLNTPAQLSLPSPFETSTRTLFECGDQQGDHQQELMDISIGQQQQQVIENGDIPNTDAVAGTQQATQDQQENIVKFSCEVCSRKYATKLTLEKHLRTHELYLCIVCDKLYHSLNDMQDHECYKKRNKTRPLHCHICLKLLSNAWSLTRHMKIHRNDDKSMLATPSTSSSSDETPKNIDIEDQFLSPVGLDDSLNSSQMQQQQPSLTLQQSHQQQIDAKSSLPVPKVPGKRLEEPMECIVCRRPFKNPNALDKHLRFVHTVTTDGTRPMYKKHAQEARLKQNLTNNTAPIKPSIAKALASKLSQKKKISQEEMLTTTNSSGDATKENAIIIFEVTQLTEDNMYDTNQLLNGGTENSTMVQKIQLPTDSQVAFQGLSPTIVCNGTTETNMIVPHPGTSEVLVDVPKMIVLKKGKKGEQPSAFRANSGEILNLDNGVIVRKDDAASTTNTTPISYNCDECKKIFAKKYQLKRHQETHDSIFYICPYCEKAPLKARSSLKKHFSREHNDKIHEWNTSNFLSKQILRDEEKLRELRKKYHDKKRLNGDKLVEAIHRAMNAEDITSTSDSLDSLVEDLDNNNTITTNGFKNMPMDQKRTGAGPKINKQSTHKKIKRPKIVIPNGHTTILSTEYATVVSNNNNNQPPYHHKTHDEHEIDNLFNNLINDNLLGDPLNGNEYDADDDQMQSVNYIQETFQNSFKEIQEKLDADLEVGSEQIKWEDNLKSDDSSDQIMSDKLLDESADLMLI